MSTSFPPGEQPFGPDYLDSSASVTSRGRGPGRRATTAIAAGVGAGVLAVGGAAAWAAVSFFAAGAQPSEALPATTLAYVSVDLDPSGAQKIEALRMLRKFPAFTDELDVALEDDLRKSLFDELSSELGCDLDYAADIEPWLGSSVAVAAVDVAADEPVAVVVLETADEDAATAALNGCSDVGAVAEDGWLLVSDTLDHAEAVASAAGSLANSADHTRLLDAAGDRGFVSGYVSPSLGESLSTMADQPALSGHLTDEMRTQFEQLESLPGAAFTVRFADAGAEMSLAATLPNDTIADVVGTQAGTLAAGLPADTAAVLSWSMKPGWGQQVLDQLATSLGQDTVDRGLAEMESEFGLTFPDDLETLLGEATALVVSSDLDAEALANSSDPSGIPAGLLVKGDAAGIQSVLDQLRSVPGAGELGQILDSDTEGDLVAIGPNSDYRSTLVAGGSLGDTKQFADAVPEVDSAASVFYVDLNAVGSWANDFGAGSSELENVEPLAAVGGSSWIEGDLIRYQMRVSTD